MKHVKYILLGLVRVSLSVIAIVTIFVWLPIVMLHDVGMGSDSEEDGWAEKIANLCVKKRKL